MPTISESQIADRLRIYYTDEFFNLLTGDKGAAYFTRDGQLLPYVSPSAVGLTTTDVTNLITLAENDRTIAKADASGFNVAPTTTQFPTADANDVVTFIFNPSGRRETWIHDGTNWVQNSIQLPSSAAGEATYLLSRGNATQNVAPTLVEVQGVGRYAAVAALSNSDQIRVQLSDGTEEWWEVVGSTPTRVVFQSAGGGTGRIVGRTATVAAFPSAAANNGQYSILTAVDGANRPGIWSSDGITWTLAIETSAATDLAMVVANMAARPSAPAEGLRVTTTSNGLTWVATDGSWVIDDLEISATTIAARDALTELQTGQRVYVSADDTIYRWNGSAWVTRPVGTTDGADSVANLAARPAVATKSDGYEVVVATNGLKYEVIDGAYQIVSYSTRVADAAARTALSELVSGQLVTQADTNAVWRWNGTTLVDTTPLSAGTYRTAAGTGPNRTTPPVAADVTSATLTALVIGSVLFRDVMGIEQRWLVNNAGIAVLDREFMPDDASPLSAVPSVAAGTGWNVGDRFTYRDTSGSPTLYKKYVVGVVGPLRVPILESYSGGSSGGTTNITITRNATSATVNSSSGTGAPIPLADGTNAGLLGPGIVHPLSGGTTFPATANRIYEIVQLTGANAGLYYAVDLVGNWGRIV